VWVEPSSLVRQVVEARLFGGLGPICRRQVMHLAGVHKSHLRGGGRQCRDDVPAIDDAEQRRRERRDERFVSDATNGSSATRGKPNV
jgi:hypothetical protein